MAQVKSTVALGQTKFRLPLSNQAVFLRPPHHRSYITVDLEQERIVEYDLATGHSMGVLGNREVYWPWFNGPARNSSRMVRPPRGNLPNVQVWDIAAKRMIFEVATPPCGDDFFGSLSDDGRRLAVPMHNPATEQIEADADMEGHFGSGVHVFDVDAQKLLWQLRTLHNYGLQARFSPTGRWLAVTGEFIDLDRENRSSEEINRTVQIFDVDCGVEIARIVIPEDCRSNPVVSFVSDRGELVVSPYQGCAPICFFDLETGRETRRLVVDEYRVFASFVISPNARYAASIDLLSGAVLRWNLVDGTLLDETPAGFAPALDMSHRNPKDMVIADDGRVTVLQVIGCAVCAWSAPDGLKVSATVGHLSPISAIVFSTDGAEIRTVSQGTEVHRWTRDGRSIGAFAVPPELRHYLGGNLHVTPHGWLIGQGREGELMLELATGRHRAAPHGYQEANYVEPAVSLDGHFYFTVIGNAMDETVPMTAYLQAIATGEKRNLGTLPLGLVSACICGSCLVVVTENEEAGTRTLAAFSLTLNPLGELWHVTTSMGEKFNEWAPANQATLRPRRALDCGRDAHFPYRTLVIPSPNGASVLVLPTDEGRRPYVVDLKNGRRSSQWLIPVMPPLAVRPDGNAVAICTGRGDAVNLLDWHTGANMGLLFDQAYPQALAWNPDGNCLAVGKYDSTLILLDVEH